MARKYLFIDESGNLDFSGKSSASRYFILTSAVSDTYDPAVRLMALRHDLVLEGNYDNHCFHATEDKQAIRDRVFEAIAHMDIRLDSTIFEKSRAYDHLQKDSDFYELAWYMHLKFIIPIITRPDDDLIIFAATIQTSKKKAEFRKSLNGTIRGIGGRTGMTKILHWPAQCEHGIQVADYCGWAVQRKWEGKDLRSYNLIQPKLQSEFDIFRDRGMKRDQLPELDNPEEPGGSYH